MTARPDVFESLQRMMPRLRADFGVSALGVFGSVARGDAAPQSDVDILVRFDPEARVTLLTLARLQRTLQELLGRPVDLTEDHQHLRPSFRLGIEKDLRYVA